MKPLLLFVHGWGFDAALWQDLRSHFPSEETLAWDLGFFGAPSRPELPSGRPILAIGHSFGLLWLLRQRHLPYHALVAINGFSRFVQGQDFPAGIALRVLQRMQARLATDPAGVVANFRALCGVTAPLPAEPHIATLAEGLNSLQNWDKRPAQITAALCGASDSLVSQEMSRACFPESKIRWHEGGHMLPLTAPVWCAQQLRMLSDSLRAA